MPFIAGWPSPTGELVPVVYDGPAMTLWSAAYVFATVLTNIGLPRRVPGQPDAGDGPERVIIARAITVAAERAGIGMGRVDSPQALSAVNMAGLVLIELSRERGAYDFACPGGSWPMPGEPGYRLFREMIDQLMLSDATIADVAADPDLDAALERNADNWVEYFAKARSALVGAVRRNAVDLASPAPLGLLGGFVNTHLRGEG